MAEAIESMSQSELRAEVARNRASKSKERAFGKAMTMEVFEKGTTVLAAIGIGLAHQQKPDLEAGLGGVGYLNPAAVVIGGAMFMLTGKKSGAPSIGQEVGSGLLFAGAVPLLNKLGAKLGEAIG